MSDLRFLAFTDGHIGTYEGAVIDEETDLNGRLIDGLNVWDEVEQYAMSNGIKTVAFLGDRFRSCNPKGYIRDLADEKLRNFACKFQFFCLVGNHDYYEKSSFYHSYGVAHVFKDELPGLVLFEKPCVYAYDTDITFWALPHGRRMDELKVKFDDKDCNIFMFHDDVVGARYPSGMKVEKGLRADDWSRFDLVLGGHIHLPQSISGCKGGYVGSVSQLKKDDEGSKRGWWDIKVHGKEIEIEKIESNAPKYIIERIEMEKGDEWNVFINDEKKKEKIKGNYFILQATLNRSVLSVIDKTKIEQILIEKCGVRFCTFEPEVNVNYEFKMPELKKTKSVEEEINVVLKRLDLQGLDESELRNVGLQICREAEIV
jgi:DNA repair exonuclease SbcCD nuclease subunit